MTEAEYEDREKKARSRKLAALGEPVQDEA
jgi:hypothetical protein